MPLLIVGLHQGFAGWASSDSGFSSDPERLECLVSADLCEQKIAETEFDIGGI